MKTALKYIGLIIVFTFISSGVLVAGFLDAYPAVGYNMLWLLLPMTALFVTAVLINDKLLIPHLLLRKKYLKFVIAVFVLVYIVTALSLGMEYATRKSLDLPMRIKDYTSPWLIADTFGNGMLLFLILLGLGLLHLFNRWNAEQIKEREITGALQSYIATVKNKLNPDRILESLQSISVANGSEPAAIADRIRSFSDNLRVQLYELPTPPPVIENESDQGLSSRLTQLLVGRRYRSQRHIIFISLLLIISCGALFAAPDRPEFTFSRCCGLMAMFVMLAGLAYINILWLYPRFLKRGNLKRYAIATVILLLLLVAPIIITQILTYDSNIYDKGLPLLIAFISTVGTVMTMFLFIGGISAFLILQNWILTQQRITLLKAETVKQEYAFLRKQINPHFLFNVLNNIGITAYEDPIFAVNLLQDLQQLLKYQLCDLNQDRTTLKKECTFIKSYFALEANRRDKFEFILDIDEKVHDIAIPTLLYIPFVENAAKYSSSEPGLPNVTLSFRVCGSKLKFTCRNPYNPDKVKKMKPGGIGVSNTLRRLQYLYDDNFTFRCTRFDNIYNVELTIPLNK